MDAKKEFADLKFKAECNDMVLTRVGNPQLVIRGPGEIWQDTNGVLQFKIFATQQAYQTLRAYMGCPGVIGQIIPDEDFFTSSSTGAHPPAVDCRAHSPILTRRTYRWSSAWLH